MAPNAAHCALTQVPDWIGVWGGDERVVVRGKPAPRLVYSINSVPKKAGGKLPDYVQATVRLPSGTFGAKFKLKS